MRTSLIVLVVIISAFIISGVAVFLICFLTHKSNRKYEQFVCSYSVSLNRLKELNDRFSFNPAIDFDQSYTYDNEAYYNTISCTDFLIYQLQFIARDILGQIKKIEYKIGYIKNNKIL